MISGEFEWEKETGGWGRVGDWGEWAIGESGRYLGGEGV